MLAQARTVLSGANQMHLWGIGAVLFTALFLLPTGVTHAQTLPPAPICSAPTITNFTPFVYEGELHSFEYSILDDQPHLPLAVQIAGQQVPQRYVTIWDHKQPGARVVHVDVPFLDLDGSTNISVVNTQVSSGSSVPGCATSVQFQVNLPVDPQPIPQPPVTPPAPPSGPTTGGGGVDAPDNNGDNGETPATSTDNGGGGGVIAPPPSDLCISAPLRVWVFLGMAALLIALISLAYMPRIAQSNALLAATILIPLILLLGVWYFFDTCRAYMWFPIAILLISLGTLVGSGMPIFLNSGSSLFGWRGDTKKDRNTMRGTSGPNTPPSNTPSVVAAPPASTPSKKPSAGGGERTGQTSQQQRGGQSRGAQQGRGDQRPNQSNNGQQKRN